MPSVRVLHDGGWIHPGGGANVAVEIARALDAPLTVGHTDSPDWWNQQDIEHDVAFNKQVHDDLLARVIDRQALRPAAELRLGQCFKSLEIEEDIVISSGTVAKWWIPRHDQTHIHYCHTPPPRLYSAPASGPISWLQQTGVSMLDTHYSRYVDQYVANSTFTQQRISTHYRRPSTVVHPPVDTSRFYWRKPRREPYLVHVGRLVPMKRVETIAEAAAMNDTPRVVFIGDGPLRSTLEEYSDVNVYPGMSDRAVALAVARSSGGIAFADHEHCGITPKEYQAAGKPVLVPNEPNLKNHVVDGETGDIVAPTPAGAARGMQRLIQADWDLDRLQEAASEWGVPRFHEEIKSIVDGGTDAPNAIQRTGRPGQATAARPHQ